MLAVLYIFLYDFVRRMLFFLPLLVAQTCWPEFKQDTLKKARVMLPE